MSRVGVAIGRLALVVMTFCAFHAQIDTRDPLFAVAYGLKDSQTMVLEAMAATIIPECVPTNKKEVQLVTEHFQKSISEKEN